MQCILAEATRKGRTIAVTSFAATYLNIELDGTTYMRQPGSFKIPGEPDKVYQLLHNLYGTHEAGALWQKLLNKKQLTIGLKPTSADPCAYFHKKDATMAAIHVDSMICVVDAMMPDGLDRRAGILRDVGASQWLQKLVTDTGAVLAPVKIFVNNQVAIALTKNPVFHAHTKHIDIQHHIIQEQVGEGSVTVEYVPTGENILDAMTKVLPQPAFARCRCAMGIELVEGEC